MHCNEGEGATARSINGRPPGAGDPADVAIVCDGSARWAEAHGLPMAAAHKAAADTALARIADAIELGARQLTLYAFSTENWTRPSAEVRALFAMLATRIGTDAPSLHAQDVRVRFIGRRDRASEVLLEQMRAAERLTARNGGMALYIAIDYGGRAEIIDAARRYRGGGEAAFAKLMYAPEMRDPDLVIRTSGEQRLSNFLLWQAAYAELVFRSELWPEFGREAFEECLAEYGARKRRFGGRVVSGRAPPQGPARARVRG
jgi:undecaprenyl diphosphate synthase